MGSSALIVGIVCLTIFALLAYACVRAWREASAERRREHETVAKMITPCDPAAEWIGSNARGWPVFREKDGTTFAENEDGARYYAEEWTRLHRTAKDALANPLRRRASGGGNFARVIGATLVAALLLSTGMPGCAKRAEIVEVRETLVQGSAEMRAEHLVWTHEFAKTQPSLPHFTPLDVTIREQWHTDFDDNVASSRAHDND